jgi:hypothetical protein
MRNALVVAVLAGALALVTFVPRGTTAPALADKPVRYEYAELNYSRGYVGVPPGLAPGWAGQMNPRGFGGGGPLQPGGGPPGGPGGAGPGGQPTPAPEVRTTVRWSTAEEQAEVKSWEELADKLKAPAAKKANSPETVHKLRVLNRLSEFGWEMMDRPVLNTGTDTVAFRRRLP